MNSHKKGQEAILGNLTDVDVNDLKELCKIDPNVGVGDQEIHIDKKSLAEMLASRERCNRIWWSDDSNTKGQNEMK